MLGLINSKRQNPVPDRTKNPISLHPKTANCEYCHAYDHDEEDLQELIRTDFYNDDDSRWGKFIPRGDDMTNDILIIRIADMKLYSNNYEVGLLATGATHCPMCGRKLREDV